MTTAFLAGLLLALIGNVLLGIAVARSAVLPRMAGLLWVVAALAFYLLGVVLGLVAAGASVPTQSASALLILVSAGWIAWSAPKASAAASAARSDKTAKVAASSSAGQG